MEDKFGLKDISGQVFGKLTVIERCENNTKSGNAQWLCICACGNKAIVNGSKLRNGRTKSCGCNRKNSVAQGYSKTRLYRIWTNMKNRCYKSSHDSYKYYGLLGIKVCHIWKYSFIDFKKWAEQNGYDDDLSIDRINSKGNYEPSNCRWINQKQQMNNVKSNHRVMYKHTNYTLSELADKFNLKHHTLTNRLKLGWSIEQAVETPERKIKNE